MREFVMDPALFADQKNFKPYVYDQDYCDKYFERNQNLGRIHFAILQKDEPIGEIILKNIAPDQTHCTLSICMKNDSCKGKGYGTAAELMALEFAFNELGCETVYADALIGNLRSQHVLEKVGFMQTHTDDMFHYYKCEKSSWKRPVITSR